MNTSSASKLDIEFQWQCDRHIGYPDDRDISHWASAALADDRSVSEVTLRIVDKSEIQQANNDWRQKNQPTNVLSFPADFPAEAEINYLGDLLICADVLREESEQQQKALHAHWAHIVVHGMLHLQGFDHVDEQEAEVMEAREVEILASFGYNNPYEYPLESKQS